MNPPVLGLYDAMAGLYQLLCISLCCKKHSIWSDHVFDSVGWCCYMSLSSLENSGLFAACVSQADGVAASVLVDARFLLDI